MRRRRPRRGEWLVRDDESGFVHRSSDVTTRWDGAVVHRDNNEQRNPQEFVTAYNDPVPVSPIRPRQDIDPIISQFSVAKDVSGNVYAYYDVAERYRRYIASSAADPDGMEIGDSLIVMPNSLLDYPA